MAAPPAPAALLLTVVQQDLLLPFLRRIDFCVLATCTQALSIQCRAVLSNPWLECAPRLVLVSSANNKLMELSVNEEDGRMMVLHDTEARCPAANTNSKTLWWPTCAAFAADGRLYVTQYQGSRVLCVSGATLAHRSSAISSSRLTSPEGVACINGCIYVASAEHRSVNRLVRSSNGKWRPHGNALQLRLQLASTGTCQDMVPWGMVSGPALRPAGSDASTSTSSTAACQVATALYVAVAEEYYAPDYFEPSEHGAGCIAVVQLAAGGTMMGCSRFGSAILKRPSGLCFDAKGNLWVSTLEQQLTCLAGPHAANPGMVLERVSTVAACSDGFPWDVQCVGDLLVMPLHSGRNNPCCVASFARQNRADGTGAWQLLHALQHELFSEPNTLCQQR